MTTTNSRYQQTHSRPRTTLNIFLLIFGYCLGQGSIFFAQSWLLLTDQLAQLATFGTIFSFAVLAMTFVEAGSITVLARAVIVSAGPDAKNPSLWIIFFSTSIVRSIYSFVAIIVFFWLAYNSGDPHYIAYALGSAPAFIIWALNCAGILDGSHRSGVSGISGSMPYLFSAIAVPFSAGLPDYEAGLLQGMTLSIGCAVTVGYQYAYLVHIKLFPRFALPRLSDVWRSAISSFHMIAGTLPGQLFYRVQLLISITYLTNDSTALFVYGYQIVSALVQMIGFIRRVEFPSLLADANNREKRFSISTALYTQRIGTIISVIMSAAVIAASAVGLVVLDGNLATACYVLLLLSPLLLTSAAALALAQGAHAIGRHDWPAVSSNIGALFGLMLSFALVTSTGLFGLAVGNVAAQLVSAMYLLWQFSRSTRGGRGADDAI